MAKLVQIFVENILATILMLTIPSCTVLGGSIPIPNGVGGEGANLGNSGAIFHQTHFQQQQQLLNNNYLGPASMQYMAMNHDGQYSFAYSGADSSREERRHQDGSVQGKYSYTNPDGKIVHVQYTADALNGFNAVGDTLPSNQQHIQQQQQLAAVVQDTPAVREARERFFETYARELARVNAAATGVPIQAHEPVKEVVVAPPPPPIQSLTTSSVTSTHSVPDSPAMTQTTQHISTTSSGSGTPATAQVLTANVKEAPVVPQQESKIYSVAGFDSDSYRQQSQAGQLGISSQQYSSVGPEYHDTSYKAPARGPAYFYYVGVGDVPYYIAQPSPVGNTNIAVSVRASQLGAIPADAVHDAQVPRFGPHVVRTNSRPSPPVYVEIGKDYQLPTSEGLTSSSVTTSSTKGGQQQEPVVIYHQTHTTSSSSGPTVRALNDNGQGTASIPHQRNLRTSFSSIGGRTPNHQLPFFRLPYYAGLAGYQPTTYMNMY